MSERGQGRSPGEGLEGGKPPSGLGTGLDPRFRGRGRTHLVERGEYDLLPVVTDPDPRHGPRPDVPLLQRVREVEREST